MDMRCWLNIISIIIGVYLMVSALWGWWVLYRYSYRPKVTIICHHYHIVSRKIGCSYRKHYYIDGEFSFVWQGKTIMQQGTGFDPSFYRFLSEAKAQKRFENWQKKRGRIGFVNTCKHKAILDIPINKKEKQVQYLQDIIFAVAMLISDYTGSILI